MDGWSSPQLKLKLKLQSTNMPTQYYTLTRAEWRRCEQSYLPLHEYYSSLQDYLYWRHRFASAGFLRVDATHPLAIAERPYCLARQTLLQQQVPVGSS